MKLQILTPDAELFNSDIETVFLPGKAKGEFQVLNDHMPLVATLDAGVVRVVEPKNGKTVRFDIKGGTAEVLDNVITVLVD